jgi:hypothetical protein
MGLAFVGVIFGMVAWINALAVRRQDREIAALDQRGR